MVRNILHHGPEVASALGGSVVPVVYGYGQWTEARWKESASKGPQMKFPRKRSLSHMVPTARLRRLLFPPPGRDGIWKGPRWVGAESRRLADRLTAPTIQPETSDALVILDPWWRCPEGFWKAVAKSRRDGARVGTVIYDLIPISHSELTGARHRERFVRWLQRAAACSDFFLAISETVKHELQDYLRDSCPDQTWPDHRFHSFTLGADLPSQAGGVVRDSVQQMFVGGNTYLMVGALEPRKNQPFLLDAFERLWNQGLDVRLCLVGSYTKSMPEFHERLSRHAESGRRLFYWSDLSDVELNYCYRKAQALVYPSIVEGFGLPIIEALQHGCPVLASNTAIHREVGGRFCAYFELDSTTPLVEKIVEFERSGRVAGMESPSEYAAPTWQRSCRELVDRCLCHLREPSPKSECARPAA